MDPVIKTRSKVKPAIWRYRNLAGKKGKPVEDRPRGFCDPNVFFDSESEENEEKEDEEEEEDVVAGRSKKFRSMSPFTFIESSLSNDEDENEKNSTGKVMVMGIDAKLRSVDEVDQLENTAKRSFIVNESKSNGFNISALKTTRTKHSREYVDQDQIDCIAMDDFFEMNERKRRLSSTPINKDKTNTGLFDNSPNATGIGATNKVEFSFIQVRKSINRSVRSISSNNQVNQIVEKSTRNNSPLQIADEEEEWVDCEPLMNKEENLESEKSENIRRNAKEMQNEKEIATNSSKITKNNSTQPKIVEMSNDQEIFDTNERERQLRNRKSSIPKPSNTRENSKRQLRSRKSVKNSSTTRKTRKNSKSNEDESQKKSRRMSDEMNASGYVKSIDDDRANKSLTTTRKNSKSNEDESQRKSRRMSDEMNASGYVKSIDDDRANKSPNKIKTRRSQRLSLNIEKENKSQIELKNKRKRMSKDGDKQKENQTINGDDHVTNNDCDSSNDVEMSPKSGKKSKRPKKKIREKNIYFDAQTLVKKKLILPESKSNFRRSKRTRIPRLDQLLGEMAKYKLDEFGNPQAIAIGSPRFFNKPRKIVKKKNAKKKSNVDNDDDDEMNESILVEKGIVSVPLAELPVVNPETNEIVYINLISKIKSTIFSGPNGKDADDNDPYHVGVTTDQESFAVGFLKVKPKCEKPMQRLKNNSLVFSVLSGCVLVTVHCTSFVARKGDVFVVPFGNKYSIQNMTNKEADLSFTRLNNKI